MSATRQRGSAMSAKKWCLPMRLRRGVRVATTQKIKQRFGLPFGARCGRRITAATRDTSPQKRRRRRIKSRNLRVSGIAPNSPQRQRSRGSWFCSFASSGCSTNGHPRQLAPTIYHQPLRQSTKLSAARTCPSAHNTSSPRLDQASNTGLPRFSVRENKSLGDAHEKVRETETVRDRFARTPRNSKT